MPPCRRCAVGPTTTFDVIGSTEHIFLHTIPIAKVETKRGRSLEKITEFAWAALDAWRFWGEDHAA